jgi:hypothetical protein
VFINARKISIKVNIFHVVRLRCEKVFIIQCLGLLFVPLIVVVFVLYLLDFVISDLAEAFDSLSFLRDPVLKHEV